MATPTGQQQHPRPPPYPQQWVVQGAAVVVKPRDYVLLSLFNTIFLNTFCCGFVALVYSIKARDCKVMHDLEGATRYGKTAKILNVVGIVLGIIIFIVIIALSVTVATYIIKKWHSMQWSVGQLGLYHHHN